MRYPDYDPRLDPPPLDDAELEALDAALAALPGDGVMNVEAIDGYLTALLLRPSAPALPPSAQWMPAIWGGDGEGSAPFASQKQRKRVVVLVLRQLRAIERALGGAPEDWEPVFSVAEHEGEEIVDAEDWCAGFLQGVALDPEAWSAQWDDAAMAPLVLLGGDDGALTAEDLRRLDDAKERDALSRAAADAVAALADRNERFRKQRSGDAEAVK